MCYIPVATTTKRETYYLPALLHCGTTARGDHLCHRPDSDRAVDVCRKPRLPRWPMAILSGHPKRGHQCHLLHIFLHFNVHVRSPRSKHFQLLLRDDTRSSRTQLWRCWVIWTALDHRLAYLVTLVPAIMLLSSFGRHPIHFSAPLLVPQKRLTRIPHRTATVSRGHVLDD